MTRRNILIIAAVVVLAVAGAAAWYLAGPGMPAAPAAKVPGYTITADDRTMGNPKAPVVVIEYAALVCPHCADFYVKDLPVMKANYIDTGKVFYVFRIFPIRPGDGPAEKLASCLPEDRYFGFVELLFRNQPKWDGDEYPGVDTNAGLHKAAQIAGMNDDDAERCLNDKTMEARINKVAADGDALYHITGTPTFVVNGAPQEAGMEWPALKKVIDAALVAKKSP